MQGRYILLAGLLLLLFGCAPNIDPNGYGVGSVGNVNRAVRAVVISARRVNIDRTNSGSGALVGGAAGGIAGSAIGNNGRANAIGAIGGIVAGAVIGSAIEGGTVRQTGVEYVVQTENGALLTVVQPGDGEYSEGQKVIVLYGSRSRLIPDNTPG